MINLKHFSEQELVNIEKIEQKFGNDYILSKNSKNLLYNCPFCIDVRHRADNDRKLYVSCETTLFHCFKCQTKGIVIKGTQSNLDILIPYLFDYFNFSDEDELNNELNFHTKLINFDDVDFIERNTVAYNYLMSRGINEDLINRYNLRNGINNNFGRIMIPNCLIGKWTDFYQGRTYLEMDPRYKNPDSVEKEKIVFNLYNQRKRQKYAYIVEGIFDVIRGGIDCLSILGSSISEYQVRLISSYKFEEIICCLDDDPSGHIGNKKLANDLMKYNDKIFTVKLPEGKDPADMGEDMFKDYCEKYKRRFIGDKYNTLFSYYDY